MSSQTTNQLGKKFLYGFIIALCVIVILVSATGVVGAWAVRRPVSDAAVALLRVVEESADTAQQVTARVDQAAQRLQGVTIELESASAQIGQNVSDQGLVMTLLPEEQEQKLTSAADSLREAFTSIQQTVASALELYRSIDRLPFVNLPAPDPEQVQKIESSIAQVESVVATLRNAIADFRSGVTDKVDQVTGALTSLNEDIQRTQAGLAQLNSRLAALEEFAGRIRQTILVVLTTLAIIITLFLAFLIYTQVVVIRLFIARWRSLG